MRNPVLPPGAGTYKGICIVLGSGGSIFSDINKATALIGSKPFDVMAANLSFLAWNGKLEHLVSLHPEKITHFYELAKGLPVDRSHHIHTHTPIEGPHCEQYWDIIDNNGTSSLYALKIAIMLGYEKIICCGMDLSGMHRFYDNPFLKTANNFSCDAIMYSWIEQKRDNPHFREKVRGTSGKTEILFGEVTREWLEAA